MNDPARPQRLTTPSIRLRRRWILLLLALALGIVAVRLADQGDWIPYYRVVDDHTIVVGSTSGPWTWTRVTSVTESATSVTIGVSSLSVPAPGFRDDRVELTLLLHDPIAARAVIDASTGQDVPRACGTTLAEPYPLCR